MIQEIKNELWEIESMFLMSSLIIVIPLPPASFFWSLISFSSETIQLPENLEASIL